ncbi:MAG: O-antigen ligase family protein [Gammaproteobacteria bacterium]|nr:O-antigen ligase family protein [Gammaproteobacteria bacterium]
MYKNIFNIKQYKFEWIHIPVLLVFLFPLFTNTIRHWVSSLYVLIALSSLVVLVSFKKYTHDLKKEEIIFLMILILHVLSTAISNTLSDWTYASKTWFFSGDVRFIFAIPIYLLLRRITEIWKYFLLAIPVSAIIIGITGIVDFMSRYISDDGRELLAEGVYGHIFQGNIAVMWSIFSYAAFDYFKNNQLMRSLCIAGAVLAAAGALVSITRNAWLSLILLYVLYFAIHGGVSRTYKSLGAKGTAAIVVIMIGIVYFMSGIEYVRDRFVQVYEEPLIYITADRSKPIEFGSLTFRLEQWRGAIYAFYEKPVFGHGIGNSGKVHNRYIREGRLNELIYQEPTERYGSPSHVHSAYFEYLGDTGIVGFVLILFVMFYAPYVAFCLRHTNGIAWRFVVLNGAAFGIASLTEVPFIRNNWVSVFLITGIIFFIWLINENESTTPRSDI